MRKKLQRWHAWFVPRLMLFMTMCERYCSVILKKTQEILRIYIHCLIKTKGGGGESHRLVNSGRDSNFGLKIISSKIKHISYLFFINWYCINQLLIGADKNMCEQSNVVNALKLTTETVDLRLIGAKHQIISLISTTACHFKVLTFLHILSSYAINTN